LGYAHEVDSKEIATEALTLASVHQNFLYNYSSEPSFTKKSSMASQSILDLLREMSEDKDLDSLPEDMEFKDLETIFKENEDVVMKYWNAWDMSDPLTAFKTSQQAVVALFVTSVDSTARDYNFFVVHLLTTSHAVRILLPLFPARHHISLVRQWWLLVIAVYIIKGRPRLVPENVDEHLGGRDWTYVQHKALNSSYSNDAHYVKGEPRGYRLGEAGGVKQKEDELTKHLAIRAMRESARTWGDDDEYYLRAAATFVDKFHGWTF
ncbi:hypothetical protein E4U53_002438, partial [Claviceps sorghi]